MPPGSIAGPAKAKSTMHTALVRPWRHVKVRFVFLPETSPGEKNERPQRLMGGLY